ncbi:MAG: hypothetical protein LKJ37_00445 [Ligilactobacillus acidipiscis]|jgi:hypothetical protein|nr:hypothetical protein [Ligilactobacillus acidipiscis]MCI1953437.1 hypothetical protein [Ligilactobacillus acidipiscis]
MNNALCFLRWFFNDFLQEFVSITLRIRVLKMNSTLDSLIDKKQALKDIKRYQHLLELAKKNDPLVNQALCCVGFDKRLADFDDLDKKWLQELLEYGTVS